MPEHEIGVYGANDDLIEIVGDVSEEYYANYNEPTHLMVGDTEIVVEYGMDGEWMVAVVDRGANDESHHYDVGRKQLVEQANDYTEAVVIETNTKSVEKLD